MKYIFVVIRRHVSTRNSLAEGRRGGREHLVYEVMREWYKHCGNGKKETTYPVENSRRWSIKSVSYDDIGDNDDDDSHSSRCHCC